MRMGISKLLVNSVFAWCIHVCASDTRIPLRLTDSIDNGPSPLILGCDAMVILVKVESDTLLSDTLFKRHRCAHGR